MSHITVEQRYAIGLMLDQNYSQVKIAKAIGRSKSVISREIARNKDQRSGRYRWKLAQSKCIKRHKQKRKDIRFTEEVRVKTEALINKDYSPEQVAGELKVKGEKTVSIERIYQHVWQDKKRGGKLHEHLRSKGRRYRKRGAAKDRRGAIKNRIGIEKRPEVVDKRSRFGDLEVDLIIGKNHKQAIVTINDRASGMLKMRKVPNKEANVVARAIIEELKDWKPFIMTITSDNGKEFADHEKISEKLWIDMFFARPYHSWERGSNENLNGLVRQYFPKSMDFTAISDQQVKQVEDKLNNRPRKRFNFKSPTFVMDQLLFNQKVAFIT